MEVETKKTAGELLQEAASEFNYSFSSPKFERSYYSTRISEIREKSKVDDIYFINSVPKSGSTFVTAVVRSGLSGRLEYGGDLEIEVEQSFSISGIERTLSGSGTVIYKAHMLPNFLNIEPIQKLSIKYVNIVRGLFDAMVSIDDHLLRGVNANGVALWPGLRIQNYHLWDENKRFDYIAHFIMPWYFAYVSGWSKLDPFSIFLYEDMVEDTEDYFARLERRWELRPGSLDPGAVSHGKNVRFNIGKIGRGEAIRDRYQGLLRQYADYYPGYDYGVLGLAD